MSILETLTTWVGNWQGSNQLQDPHANSPEDSPSNLTVTSILKGKFIRMDYTWAYHGDPQEGSFLIGYEANLNIVTVHWMDTWHMSDKVMICQGKSETDNELSVQGSYAAPPGPDWGWRIGMKSENNQTLRIIMYNLSPEGQAYLAVEAEYILSEKVVQRS
jgi:Protein of unknown function (DUF1579)